MEGSKVEMTLKLEPFGEAKDIAVLDAKNEDNWLENDNAELIDDKNLMPSHSDDKVISCNSLTIRSTVQGYELLIDQDEILLQDGDIISLPGINLKTTIIKEHIVPLETPRKDILQVPEPVDDIWSNNEITTTNTEFADLFAQKPAQPLQQDPLDFLYDTEQRRPATTPENYALLPSPGEMDPRFHGDDLKDRDDSKGNVLHELGINEASSTIVNKQYTTGKSSFLDQSPMDMLDEYLNFDEDIDVNDFKVMPEAQKPALPNGISNLAKKAKKAVKAFTEDE